MLQALEGTRIRLLIDRTEWEEHNLLYVAVAYRKRVVPLVWRELGHRGCSKLAEQKELLDVVADWLPVGSEVWVIGDREFRGTGLMGYVRGQEWHYELRLKGDTGVVKASHRRQLDGHRKRHLSYFQLGLRWLSRCLARGDPLRIDFALYP